MFSCVVHSVPGRKDILYFLPLYCGLNTPTTLEEHDTTVGIAEIVHNIALSQRENLYIIHYKI